MNWKKTICNCTVKKLCKDWFSRKYNKHIVFSPNQSLYLCITHGLRTPREEVAFTGRPKIESQSQIFSYGRSIFCLPHRPKFSDIFDEGILHWVSVVLGITDRLVPIKFWKPPSLRTWRKSRKIKLQSMYIGLTL